MKCIFCDSSKFVYVTTVTAVTKTPLRADGVVNFDSRNIQYTESQGEAAVECAQCGKEFTFIYDEKLDGSGMSDMKLLHLLPLDELPKHHKELEANGQ